MSVFIGSTLSDIIDSIEQRVSDKRHGGKRKTERRKGGRKEDRRGGGEIKKRMGESESRGEKRRKRK